MTLLVLIFGEILPKSFAKDSPEAFALQVAGVIAFLRTLFSPVVWFFVKLKQLLTGRRSAGLELQPSVTEDELKTIIDTVEEEGVLDSQETEIIQSAIEFDDITVQEILVPRVDMVAVDVNDPVDEIVNTVLDNSFTRIPVYEGDIDHIIGMLHTRDLFECLARSKAIDVRAMCRELPFVYRTKRINDLLAEFRRQKQHMAIVTDDYGGTLGLVTLEDVLKNWWARSSTRPTRWKSFRCSSWKSTCSGWRAKPTSTTCSRSWAFPPATSTAIFPAPRAGRWSAWSTSPPPARALITRTCTSLWSRWRTNASSRCSSG